MRRFRPISQPQRVLAASLAGGALLAAAACGAVNTTRVADPATPTGSAPTGSAAAVSGPAALVPADIRAKGELVMATDPTYPPFEKLDADQKTIIGLDPDVATAIGEKLGLKITFVKAGFESIIPGLAANRYDAAISGMSDTPKRREKVDFVDYFIFGGVIMVRKDGDLTGAPDLAALCGRKVAMQKGTVQVDYAKEASEKCLADGKPEMEVNIFATIPASALALDTRRVEAVLTDNTSAGETVKAGKDKFVVTPALYGKGPAGIILPKGKEGLRDAIKAGLQAIIDDGSYLQILKKYQLEQGAVTSAEINTGT